MKKLTFIFVLFAQMLTAQTSQVTDLIGKMDLKKDTIKSVYDWVTQNIRYDVALLEARKSKDYKPPKFKNQTARKQHILKRVISRKKGVCQHYAMLFNEIVNELGYQGHVVEGMTKNKKGKLNRETSHAWNAVKVNGTWKLYDTTWGAGGISDGKFRKNYTDRWYETSPQEMLKNHMPFDPLWQFANTPMTYAEFADKNFELKSSGTFKGTSKVDQYLKLDEKTQIKEELSRSEKMGSGISLLTKWRKRKQKFLDGYAIYTNPNLFKETNEKCKKSTDLFNDYIAAKNKRFKGKKWTVEYSTKTLLKIKQQYTDAIEIYENTDVQDTKMKNFLAKSTRQAEGLLKNVNQELKFIETLK